MHSRHAGRGPHPGRAALLSREERLPAGRRVADLDRAAAQLVYDAAEALRGQIGDWLVFGLDGEGRPTAELIGRGSYGVVFGAHRCRPGTRRAEYDAGPAPYAAKLVRICHDVPVQDFWNEQAIADDARTAGVPVVPLKYAAVLESGRHTFGVLMMERCTGSLTRLLLMMLAREPPAAAARRFVETVEPGLCAMMDSLAAAGIMHCDVTPANVLWRERPDAPLLDAAGRLTGAVPDLFLVDFGFAAVFEPRSGMCYRRGRIDVRNLTECKVYDRAFCASALNAMLQACPADLGGAFFTLGLEPVMLEGVRVFYEANHHRWPTVDDYRCVFARAPGT